MNWTLRTEAFKQMACKKYLLRNHKTTKEISAELGVASGTIHGWLKKYGGNDTILSMRKPEKRPQDWSALEKMRACSRFEELSESQQGEFLRKEGLSSASLEQWKKCCLEALSSKEALVTRSDFYKAQQHIKELERDLLRKNKALAETAALLVLKKKANSLWGVEEIELS